MTPTLSPNVFSDIDQLLSYQFMVNALEAGTIVAVMAGLIGWFMVLRRQSFAGHTLSVMAFPGAAGASLAGVPLAAGYYLACGAAALAMAAGGRSGRQSHSSETATIGVVQATGLALGFLFLSLDKNVLGGLENLLFGTFLGITPGQVLTLLVVACLVIAVLAVAGRPLLFASIDPGVARAHGVPVGWLSTGFLLVLGLAIAATAQITGALLVFALLVAPAASAQVITTRPAAGLALTVALGLLTTWLGLGLAYFSPYPVGFFITTVAFAVYALAHLLRLARARAREKI